MVSMFLGCLFFLLGFVGGEVRVGFPAYPPGSVSGLISVIGSLICGTRHVFRLNPYYFSRRFRYSLFVITCIFLAPPSRG